MTLEYLKIDDRIELKLIHGPCNEIGSESLKDFENFLDTVNWKEIKSLILYSGLDRGFCAGADLREFYTSLLDTHGKEQSKRMKEFLDRIHKVMTRFDTLPVTTIGVIHGVCFGGGFELALTMDIRIAEPSARFCFPELRLGILPCFGGIPRLRREVGNGVVRDLLLSGRSLNAKRAHELGIVSQIVRAEEGLRAARSLAKQVSKFDAETLQVAKAFIKQVPEEELQKEKEIMLELFQKDTLKNALKKFVEDERLQPYLP